MYMHIQQTGSGLVWLKERFFQDSVFSGLWFFTGLPELLLPGEASTTKATTHSRSTGNSGHNRKILFTKELNGLIYQIGKHTKKWLGLCHEGDNNTNLCYLWHNLPQEWKLDPQNYCSWLYQLEDDKLRFFSRVDTSHPSPLPAFKKKYFSSSEH